MSVFGISAGVVKFQPASKSALTTGYLSFTGSSNNWQGLLNLTTNDMIVHFGSLATITNEIKEGYNSGSWTGAAGITSSSAALASNTALGIELNVDGTHVLFSTFDGQPVSSGDVLVKFTYYGDANLDGVVNGSDYTLIDNGFNNNLTNWHNGDFNYDGVVNGDDYTLIDNAFNTQGASLAGSQDFGEFSRAEEMIATSTAQIASIPEPTTGLVVCAGAQRCSRCGDGGLENSTANILPRTAATAGNAKPNEIDLTLCGVGHSSPLVIDSCT